MKPAEFVILSEAKNDGYAQCCQNMRDKMDKAHPNNPVHPVTDKRGRREFYIAALGALLIDQISKALVKSLVPLGESITVIRDVFDIAPGTNTGAAFGIFQNWGYLLALISLVVIFAIVKLRSERSRSRLLAVALGLVLGGATGNLIDRIWLKGVYDFLDFHAWPVFNLADAAVTIGGALLVLYWMAFSRRSE